MAACLALLRTRDLFASTDIPLVSLLIKSRMNGVISFPVMPLLVARLTAPVMVECMLRRAIWYSFGMGLQKS